MAGQHPIKGFSEIMFTDMTKDAKPEESKRVNRKQ